MWHASTSLLLVGTEAPDFLRDCALQALHGVGDASLGEWEQYRNATYHVRRRLTPHEQRPIGDAVDIRGTAEAEQRRKAVVGFLPPYMRDWIE